MKILLIGGSGQLGTALKKEFIKKGIPFSAPSSDLLDITVVETLESYINYLNPDIVINCAAFTNVDLAESERIDCKLINATGVANIITTIQKLNLKFLHISTDYVFAGSSSIPILRNSKKNPINFYGETKSIAEDLIINSYARNTLIIRTAWLYSEGYNNFTNKIITLLRDTEGEIPVVIDQIGQPSLAEDIAKRIFLLIELNFEPGIYHLTNSGSTSRYEFAKEIARLMQKDVNRIIETNSEYFKSAAKRPHYSVLDDDYWQNYKLSKIPHWKDAIQRYINAIRAI